MFLALAQAVAPAGAAVDRLAHRIVGAHPTELGRLEETPEVAAGAIFGLADLPPVVQPGERIVAQRAHRRDPPRHLARAARRVEGIVDLDQRGIAGERDPGLAARAGHTSISSWERRRPDSTANKAQARAGVSHTDLF